MRLQAVRAVAACVFGCAVAGTSFGAIKNNYVAAEARAVAGGRDVYIIVPQAEIKPNINISNITAATGGGLLFALIDAGVNNARAKEAEKIVVPIRESMVGFDFDPLAQGVTTATLSGLGWFDPKQIKLTKDNSDATTLAALDAAGTPQLMLMRYSYETNAQFSSIVVSLDSFLVNKETPKGKKPAARLQTKYLPYMQKVRSMILLPGANDKDPEGNVKAWSADGGKLARAAVELGLERCQALLTKSLSMSAADAGSMVKRNKRPMSAVPGVTGWVMESQPDNTLIYEFITMTLTRVETFSPGAAPAVPATPVAPAPTEAPAAPASPTAPAQ